MKGKIIAFIAMLAVVTTVYSFGASDLSDMQKKLSNANAQIEKIQKELKANANKQKKISSEKKLIDYKMEKAQQELNIVQKKIEEVTQNIEDTKKEIVKAQDNIDSKNGELEKRVRSMYKNGNVGYLEVLLGAKDFSDFLSRMDMVRYIMKQDNELIDYMKDQKTQIEDKKKELEIENINLAAVKEQANTKKNNLLIASREKDQLLVRLNKDKKAMEDQENEMEKEAKQLEKAIKEQMSSKNYSGGIMKWPVPAYHYVTSPFGMRLHPVYKKMKFHGGVDLRARSGTNIVAANDGVVQFAGWLGTYGKCVIIDHGGKIATVYAHNSRLLVKKGQSIKKGQVISKAGSTGASTASHLHFEVRKNGTRENPLPWIQ